MPGWSYADVLPYFKRAEHNERVADAFHGQGGPLNVADPRSPSAFAQLWSQAAEQQGIRATPTSTARSRKASASTR